MATKTLDQIATDNPVSTLDGSETFVVQKAGITRGGALSILKNWVKNNFGVGDISDATAIGKSVLQGADAAAIRSILSAQQTLTLITQVDAENGSATSIAGWSAERVKQAIEARKTDATTSAKGVVKQAAAVADLSGSPTLTDVVHKMNALLSSLRTAGVLAP